jgi:hypothetical protein
MWKGIQWKLGIFIEEQFAGAFMEGGYFTTGGMDGYYWLFLAAPGG